VEKYQEGQAPELLKNNTNKLQLEVARASQVCVQVNKSLWGKYLVHFTEIH
jgi:hypothetical protein